MRIAHINVISTASTGRIATELCRMSMSRGHRALLFHARGYVDTDVPDLRVGSKLDTVCHAALARLTDRAGFFSKRATEKLVRQLKEYKPDIVHLHNIHGYYLHLPTLFAYLKQNDVLTVWTLHDCWAFTGHCAYYTTNGLCQRWLTGCGRCPLLRDYPRSWFVDQSARNWREKRALFSGVKHMVLVTPSEWLKGEVQRSFLANYPVYALPNGIDLTLFKPCVNEDFMRETVRFYGLERVGDRPLVLSVANVWEPRKGLDDLIGLAERLGDDYRVAAVGLDEDQIKSLPKHTVLGVGRTGNLNDLCALYTAATLYVSLSHGETMGMTIVEALACGTQALCYQGTAMPETITDDVGETVPLGDLDAAAEAVRRMCQSPRAPERCRERAEEYDAATRFLEYDRLYDQMYHHSPAYIRAVDEACGPRAGKRKAQVE